jgi:hypothetical protein
MAEFSLSRRRFAFGAAAATAAMALPGRAISAGSAPEQSSTANPSPQATPTPATLEQQAQEAFSKLSPSAQAEVEMKYRDVLRKYGDKLSGEQKTDVRKVLAETQEGLEAMRAFALANGDQPSAVFHIYRGEGKK